MSVKNLLILVAVALALLAGADQRPANYVALCGALLLALVRRDGPSDPSGRLGPS